MNLLIQHYYDQLGPIKPDHYRELHQLTPEPVEDAKVAAPRDA